MASSCVWVRRTLALSAQVDADEAVMEAASYRDLHLGVVVGSEGCQSRYSLLRAVGREGSVQHQDLVVGGVARQGPTAQS